MFLPRAPDEHVCSRFWVIGRTSWLLHGSRSFASLPFTAKSQFPFNYPCGLISLRLLSTKMPHSELVALRTHTATQAAAGPRLHFLSKSVSVFTQGSVHKMHEGGGGSSSFRRKFCELSPDKVLAHQASSFLGALNIQTGRWSANFVCRSRFIRGEMQYIHII